MGVPYTNVTGDLRQANYSSLREGKLEFRRRIEQFQHALKRHDAAIAVWVDGIAASIASMIAMAGDEVAMPENAMLMLHDPSGLVMGTASDMRAMAEALDRMKAGMVAAYRDKSGRDDAEIEALMTAETWLSGEEAVALGLADRVQEPVRMAAHFDLSRFRNAPPQLAALPTTS